MNNTVLVSGASSGLGRATAEYLAQHGFRVYAGARSFKNETVSAPEGCEKIYLDVTDKNTVQTAVDTIVEKEGGLFALVNCAAFFVMSPCETVSQDDLRAVMETNFIGMTRTVQAVLPVMRKQGYGRIINFSSLNGLVAIPFQGAYTASKFAIEGWSEALAQETARFGIRVTLVEPGDSKGGSQKYRILEEKGMDADSPYREYFKVGTDKIHHDESNGLDSSCVAKAVCKLLKKKRPAGRKIVASPMQSLSVFMKVILPRNLFNSIVSGYYAPKK